MKSLVSILVLATVGLTVGLTVCLAEEQQQQQQQQQQAAQAAPAAISGAQKAAAQQQQQAAADRQGRSISTSGSAGNSLLSGSGSNFIEHSTSKLRMEQEKRAVQEFLTAKNILKSIVKLLFGSQDEVSATSRNVLGVMSKVLDLFKNSFGQRSRSGTARTIRDTAEEVASASISMLQGYVKSLQAPADSQCAKRYLCQASREATRDGRDLGYMVATVGGYATSYLLDSSKSNGFNSFYEASIKGRSNSECAKLYADCPIAD